MKCDNGGVAWIDKNKQTIEKRVVDMDSGRKPI